MGWRSRGQVTSLISRGKREEMLTVSHREAIGKKGYPFPIGGDREERLIDSQREDSTRCKVNSK